MTYPNKFQRLRWTAISAQALIIAILPFIQIGGQSALRFDIPTFRIYFFGGTIWVGEYLMLLFGGLAWVFTIITATLVVGRVWCGWACPQTALMDIVTAVVGSSKGAGRKVIGHIFKAMLAVFVSANLIWYFVSPYQMVPELLSWSMGPITRSFFIIMAAALFLHFEFLGRKFCATVCPYAKMQGMLLDKYSLVVAYDTDRSAACMGCDLCKRVCPTGIDIKVGLQMQCVACAKCIDACRAMTKKKGVPPFVEYVFGSREGRLQDAVTKKVMTFAGIVLLLSGLVVYQISGRQMIELDASRLPGSPYRMLSDGTVANSYRLGITNKSSGPQSYTVSVEGIPGADLVSPENPVKLDASGKKTMVVFVRANPDRSMHGPVRMKIVVAGQGVRAESATSFFFP